MKKILLMPLTALLVSCTLYTALAQQPQSNAKMAKDKQNEKDVLAFNMATKKDYAAKYDAFKKNADARIESNSDKIKKLKDDYPADATVTQKEDFNKRVTYLEQKNDDLKMRLKAYKPESNWGEFKTKFNHDMKNLGHSFSAFGSKDKG
jgi:hypothetical protein